MDHVNRDETDRRLERLCDDYGACTVIENDERVPADRFDRLLEDARAGYTGGGYAWVVREPADAPGLSAEMPEDAGESTPVVLAILHRGDGDRWKLPGGGREDGETYEEATVREVREETDIDVDLGPAFLAYRAVHAPADGRDVRVHALWVAFDAAYDGGRLAIQPGELRGGAWLADPPRELGPWAQYRAREWWDDYEPAAPWWEEGDPYEEG